MFELSLMCPEDRIEAVSDALDALDALSVSVEDADAQTDAEQALFGEQNTCLRPRRAGSAAGWWPCLKPKPPQARRNNCWPCRISSRVQGAGAGAGTRAGLGATDAVAVLHPSTSLPTSGLFRPGTGCSAGPAQHPAGSGACFWHGHHPRACACDGLRATAPPAQQPAIPSAGA